MPRKVKIKDFEKELDKIIDDYGTTINDKTRAAALAATKVAVSEVKSNSPVHSGTYVNRGKRKPGKYRKGWTSKERKESRLRTETVVYNKTDYQLTHLLEKGHALKRGGRTIGHVPAIEHIAPAEEHAVKNFESAVRKIIQEG